MNEDMRLEEEEGDYTWGVYVGSSGRDVTAYVGGPCSARGFGRPNTPEGIAQARKDAVLIARMFDRVVEHEDASYLADLRQARVERDEAQLALESVREFLNRQRGSL